MRTRASKATTAWLASVVASLAFACGGGGSTGNDPASGSSSGSSGASSTSSGSSGTSSSGSSGDCADCGKCGIAGEVTRDAVRMDKPGVDAEKRAAVGLRIVKQGECEGESQRRSTLRLSNDTFEVVPHEALDESVVSLQSQKYTWSDRELTLEIDAEPDGLFLRFVSAGKPLHIVCRPDGEAARCEKAE